MENQKLNPADFSADNRHLVPLLNKVRAKPKDTDMRSYFAFPYHWANKGDFITRDQLKLQLGWNVDFEGWDMGEPEPWYSRTPGWVAHKDFDNRRGGWIQALDETVGVRWCMLFRPHRDWRDMWVITRAFEGVLLD